MNVSKMSDKNNEVGRRVHTRRDGLRRSAENELFDELSSLIPVTLDKDQKFDKISILRLVTSYMKSRQTLESVKKSAVGEVDSHYKQSNGEDPILPRKSVIPSDVDINLPEAVVTQLHEQFMTEKDDVNKEEQMQKLESYKEALERGMKDFLSDAVHQSVPYAEESNEGYLHEMSNSGEISVGQQVKTSTIVVSAEKPTLNPISVSPHRAIAEHRRNGELMKIDNAIKEGRLMLKASHGFLLILEKDLRITFVSDNVSDLLGHEPATMLGNNLEDFMYPDDVPELRRHLQDEVFNLGLKKRVVTTRRILHLAMKYSFLKPGTRMRDTGYVLVQWNMNIQLKHDSKNDKKTVTGLVALCEVMKGADNLHRRLDLNWKMFTLLWSVDAKIVGGDIDRLRHMTGYTIDQYHESMKHKYTISVPYSDYASWLPKFFEQGYYTTDYFGIKDASGQWLWLYSHMTLLHGKDIKSHRILMDNYLVSEEDIVKYMKAHKNEGVKLNPCPKFVIKDYIDSKPKQLKLDLESQDHVELFQKNHSPKSVTSQRVSASPITFTSSFEIVNNQKVNIITVKDISPQVQNEKSDTYIDVPFISDMENDLLHSDSDHVNELLENIDSDNLEKFTQFSPSLITDVPINENLINTNQQLSPPDCDLLAGSVNSFGNSLGSGSSSSETDGWPDNCDDADVDNWIDSLDKFLHQDSNDTDFILPHIKTN